MQVPMLKKLRSLFGFKDQTNTVDDVAPVELPQDLDAAYRKRTLEIIQEKIPKYAEGSCKCAACGSAKFEFSDPLELRTYNQGLYIAGAPLIPVVAITCCNCGYVELYSAVLLGLISTNGKRVQ